MTWVEETRVAALLPFGFRPAAQVTQDGQGGVTPGTWTMLRESVETELDIRLGSAGVSAGLRSHLLVVHAANLLMAAQVCRRVQAYKDTADSYFAEANVKLRLFFEKVAEVSESQGSAQMVVPTATLIDDSDLSQATLRLSVFEGISL